VEVIESEGWRDRQSEGWRDRVRVGGVENLVFITYQHSYTGTARNVVSNL